MKKGIYLHNENHHEFLSLSGSFSGYDTPYERGSRRPNTKMNTKSWLSFLDSQIKYLEEEIKFAKSGHYDHGITLRPDIYLAFNLRSRIFSTKAESLLSTLQDLKNKI